VYAKKNRVNVAAPPTPATRECPLSAGTICMRMHPGLTQVDKFLTLICGDSGKRSNLLLDRTRRKRRGLFPHLQPRDEREKPG